MHLNHLLIYFPLALWVQGQVFCFPVLIICVRRDPWILQPAASVGEEYSWSWSGELTQELDLKRMRYVWNVRLTVVGQSCSIAPRPAVRILNALVGQSCSIAPCYSHWILQAIGSYNLRRTYWNTSDPSHVIIIVFLLNVCTWLLGILSLHWFGNCWD